MIKKRSNIETLGYRNAPFFKKPYLARVRVLKAVRELVMVTPVALDDALEDGGLHGVDARGGASGREFERVKRIRALPLWQRSCRSAACSVIIIIDRASRSAVQPDIGSLIVIF